MMQPHTKNSIRTKVFVLQLNWCGIYKYACEWEWGVQERAIKRTEVERWFVRGLWLRVSSEPTQRCNGQFTLGLLRVFRFVSIRFVYQFHLIYGTVIALRCCCFCNCNSLIGLKFRMVINIRTRTIYSPIEINQGPNKAKHKHTYAHGHTHRQFGIVSSSF